MATNVQGKVQILSVRDDWTILSLSDLPASSTPQSGVFQIRKSAPNYFSLYNLALAAAINRYTLQVTTTKNITNEEVAVVKFLQVVW